MVTWSEIYNDVVSWMNAQGVRPLLFRGQADASWKLLPKIARYHWIHKPFAWTIEHNAYYDFMTQAGSLLPEAPAPWHVPFAMQHHGLATRLLDWSDTFAVALHFALIGGNGEAAVWLLNPFRLNERTIRKTGIFHPTDLGYDYADLFIHRTAQLPGGVVAVLPLRHQSRLFSQRGAFTVHADLTTSLEERFPEAIRKIVIPSTARNEAATFLELAGVSEFSLFPDLDGLARDVTREHFERPDDARPPVA